MDINARNDQVGRDIMKNWQFNILFFVGVGGAVFLLIAPEFGMDISSNPTALTGVGAILTYILTQRGTFSRSSNKDERHKRHHHNDSDDSDNPLKERLREELEELTEGDRDHEGGDK